MQKEKWYYNTPEEAAEGAGAIEGAYVIKVKCLGCSETGFVPYDKISTEDGKLSVGTRFYPLSLVEQISVRTMEKHIGRVEYVFKVCSEYFQAVLRDEAIEELKKHHLC